MMRTTCCSGLPEASDPGPAGHSFGHRVEVGDVAGAIGADHRIANRVQDHLRELRCRTRDPIRGLGLAATLFHHFGIGAHSHSSKAHYGFQSCAN
jgi:hypothetical protein